MLFNSPEFIFIFLPATLLGWYFLARNGPCRSAVVWLVLASLIFYGWWNPKYLVLIGVSMAFNFLVGKRLSAPADGAGGRGLLVFGVAANLALLGFFKYTNFFVENINAATGLAWPVPGIVLPLGISFFTFQQIGYLVDAKRGITREYRFADYCLFVTFFPQLIAGPIVHHKDILPQFKRPELFTFDPAGFGAGVTWFTIGWFKKAVLADGISAFVSPVFSGAAEGVMPGFWSAWGAALAYTCQIYYDFSGYSDMAIGLGLMCGIRIPMNFNSPYQASDIIDFWRRWHITLSAFLRDYLYIPLGGNRLGKGRRYLNLFLTMLLGGIWHGAGWTFLAWGALHGVYLLVNHAWNDFRGSDRPPPGWFGRIGARSAAFVAVVVGWVFFRADGLPSAARILSAMANPAQAGFCLAEARSALPQIAWTVALLSWAWFAPGTRDWMAGAAEFLPKPKQLAPKWLAAWFWRPGPLWAAITAVIFLVALMHLSRVTEFLYFQF
jgi:D-alanyl-lipoteichoic acid acyltransferase DltB (MBOAT superfamily)